uniref:Putative secreted peptide n=1 Tax=Anopheles braziliensis TaxID=58242 RepID=A0A2M3ZW72_9DIPT
MSERTRHGFRLAFSPIFLSFLLSRRRGLPFDPSHTRTFRATDRNMDARTFKTPFSPSTAHRMLDQTGRWARSNH